MSINSKNNPGELNRAPIMDEDDAHRADAEKPIPVHAEFYRRLDVNHPPEEIIQALIVDAGLSRDVAICAWETMSEFSGRKNGHINGDTRESHDGVRRLLDLMERGWMVYERYAKNFGSQELALRCYWLLMGSTVAAGASDMTALSKLLGVSKQTTNKCLKAFQSQMPELPLLPGQRGFKAREKMREARLEQVRK